MSLSLIFVMIMSSSQFGLSKYRIKTIKNNAEYTINLSKKHNFEPSLIFALIYIESGWKASAESNKGACGLTQVLPKYTGNKRGGLNSAGVERLSCKELKNPKISIRAGIKTLSWWRKYHSNDITRALCSYNAGFRCGGTRDRPVSRGGMRYARKVLAKKRYIDNKIHNLKISIEKSKYEHFK